MLGRSGGGARGGVGMGRAQAREGGRRHVCGTVCYRCRPNQIAAAYLVLPCTPQRARTPRRAPHPAAPPVPNYPTHTPTRFPAPHRLYAKAKALMDPFAYETYRQQRIAKKMEEERTARISILKKLPKVRRRAWCGVSGRPTEGRMLAWGCGVESSLGLGRWGWGCDEVLRELWVRLANPVPQEGLRKSA